MSIVNHFSLSGIPNCFRAPSLEQVSPVVNAPVEPSLADKSYFHPDYAIVRAATGSQTIAQVGAGNYLYPDGKDIGADMPLAYRRGVDLAELSQEIYAKDKVLSDTLEKALRQNSRNFQRQSQAQQTQQVQQQVLQPVQNSVTNGGQ